MEKKIKKGHLYFHLVNKRVERIVQVESASVAHRWHSVASVSLASDFRLATREEVSRYLGK
jgi:hypothetical protein